MSSAMRIASSIRVSTIWDSGTVLITSPLTKICPLPLPEGDAEVCLARLAGSVDDAAHDRHPQRDLEPVEPGGHLVGQLVDVDLGSPAGGARDDLELALTQVQRLEDLEPDLDLLDGGARTARPRMVSPMPLG